jgi:arylsulfatase
MKVLQNLCLALLAFAALDMAASTPAAAQKKPNVVMLMADDIGSADLGVAGGGVTLGHPTPKIDQLAREGAYFTDWYGQASCTAGRASFQTGRMPIRSALSVVMVVGDKNGLRKRRRRSPSFTRRTATTPTTPASGIWATSPSSTRSSMATTR